MKGYYYLMSSLPALDCTGDSVVPFTSEQFLDSIRMFVPAKDYEIIGRIVRGEDVSCPLVKKYNYLKCQIESQLAERRAQKLGFDIQKYKNTANRDSAVAALIDKAVSCDNPLEAEMMIYSIYWKSLDEIALMHKFDFTELAVYAIKLKLLLRKEQFNRERGRGEFDRLFSSLHVSLED